MNQQRTGILISYFNLVLGLIVTVFLTPLMIRTFGDVDYSIYKVMQSFAGPLSMFHLGISTVVTRSIVEYNRNSNCSKKDKQNTMAIAMLVSVGMSVFVIIASIIMYFAIPDIYGSTYSLESLKLARKIFIVFVASAILHMLTDAFSGCVIGHEKFIVSSSVVLMKTVVKLVLNTVFIFCGMNVFYIAISDLIISIITFIFMSIYSMYVLSEVPKIYYLNKKQLIEIFSFGMAIFLQALVNQVNNNVDTIILGAMVNEKAIITMYSSALTIYAIYNSIISAITNIFLPKATSLVLRNASGSELTDFVIAPGRFQAIIAVACVCGFTLFGRDFISLWIGNNYLDAYWVTLVLIIPVTIPLVENVAISILDAALKRMYRSMVLVIMAIVNVVISIVLIKNIGFWGAAIGTVISLIIGHGILMNIYYHKTFKMEIARMFISIFKGILSAGLAASIVCLPLSLFVNNNTVFIFLIKCISFLLAYAVFLLLFGINESEKAILKEFITRKHRG